MGALAGKEGSREVRARTDARNVESGTFGRTTGSKSGQGSMFQFYDMIKIKTARRERVEGEFDDPQMVTDEAGVRAKLKE
jgi:hypothetical protein